MKKICKIISVLILSLTLVGCMKVQYQIDIKDKDDIEANLKVLYSKEMIDTYGLSQDDIKAQLESEEGFEGWTLTKINEKIDNEEYVGYNAKGPKEAVDSISDSLTVSGDKYTLKLESDTPISNIVGEDEVEQLGYSVEQLEKMGLEIEIKITMPGKITNATLGKINDNVVTIGLMDLNNANSNEITIVSKASEKSNSTGLIVGGVVIVIVAIAGVYFYKNKKKPKNINEPTVDNTEE